MECRIYAEDPDNGFFPSPGRITRLVQPGGPGIREDSGVYEGWVVPMDYDPMLSKLVAYAPTREMAIERLLRALNEYAIVGIRTNLGLFRRILSDADFQAARIDTGYLDRLLGQLPPKVDPDLRENREKVASIAAAIFESQRAAIPASTVTPVSAWKQAARAETLQ